MKYFAKVENKIVTQVIVATQEVIDSGLFGHPSYWFETKIDGKNEDGTPFRRHYAAVGCKYDAEQDAFIIGELPTGSEAIPVTVLGE